MQPYLTLAIQYVRDQGMRKQLQVMLPNYLRLSLLFMKCPRGISLTALGLSIMRYQTQTGIFLPATPF